MTCAECQHFNRCQWLIGVAGPESECDWQPSRFKPKEKSNEETDSSVTANCVIEYYVG